MQVYDEFALFLWTICEFLWTKAKIHTILYFVHIATAETLVPLWTFRCPDPPIIPSRKTRKAVKDIHDLFLLCFKMVLN